MRRITSFVAVASLTACGLFEGREPPPELVSKGEPQPCIPTELNSTSPVATVLAGSVTIERGWGVPSVKVSPEVEVYMPEGRSPYSRVYIGQRRPSPPYSMPEASGILPPSLGIQRVDIGYGPSGKMEVWQQDSLSPVQFRTELDLAQPGETPDIIVAEGTLCSTGINIGPGELLLLEPGSTLPPTMAIQWASTVPLDDRTLSKDAKLLADGKPVAGGFWVDHWGLGFGFEGALPPNTNVELVVDGLRDIIGRPVRVTREQPTLATTETISDFTFEQMPPFGAIALDGAAASTEDGVLKIGMPGTWRSSYHGLVALGDHGNASKVRVRARLDCAPEPFHGVWPMVSLVASTGRSTEVPVKCSDTFAEFSVPVPASGPLWLAFVIGSSQPYPRDNPGPQYDSLLIDEISFE